MVPLVSDLTAHKEINLNGIVFYEQVEILKTCTKRFVTIKAIESKKVKILELQSKLSLITDLKKSLNFCACSSIG